MNIFIQLFLAAFRKEYQNTCDNYLIRSINHDMFLQKVEKKTLNTLDEKRKYEIAIESLPWN